MTQHKNSEADIVTVIVQNPRRREEKFDRMRASTNEKDKGAMIIGRLMDYFGFLTYQEVEESRNRLLKKEAEDQLKNNQKQQWARDKYGNPTYPIKSNI